MNLNCKSSDELYYRRYKENYLINGCLFANQNQVPTNARLKRSHRKCERCSCNDQKKFFR